MKYHLMSWQIFYARVSEPEIERPAASY